MNRKRVFISFDYDNDVDIKNCLVGQARNPDSPFDIADYSIKEPITFNWKDNARRRIKGCDVVIILCGHYTNKASGVTAELDIVHEEKIPYFCLNGRNDIYTVKPQHSLQTDKLYDWTWNNLKLLLGGAR